MTDITADVSLVGALEIETDVRGVRGESAYAIAVRNGFVGTEEEWLASLKGEQGERGEQGIQGVKGDTGATGPKGDKGDQGERGPQGEQGVKGDTGAKGDKGDPGADGQPGAKGDKGDKGDTGAKGDKGDKGDTGATGVAGAKGDDGFSPTVSVTDITGGHRVAITDASGSHTFDVMDGDAGSQGTMDYTDLTNKPSINNVTLSGNKSLSDLGIPSTSNLPDLVADWMEDNITDDPTVVIDSSLSVSGAAADAKKTGDEIADLKSAITVNDESGSTSSHAYAVGSYLKNDGALYRVTSPIAVGDTLTEGTNIEETSVCDELDAAYNGRATSVIGSINKLNTDAITADKIISSSGELVTLNGYDTTDFIELNTTASSVAFTGLNAAGTARVCLPINVLVFYDSTQTNILERKTPISSNTVTAIPEGAEYARFGIDHSYVFSRNGMVEFVDSTSGISATFVPYEEITDRTKGINDLIDDVEDLEGLPDEFDTLSGSVSTLSAQVAQNTSAISEIEGTAQTLDNLETFSNGGINSNTGTFNNYYVWRIATQSIITLTEAITVTIASGFRLYVAYFVNDTFSSAGWVESGTKINSGSKVRLMVARSTDDETETADIDTFCSKVTYIVDGGLTALREQVSDNKAELERITSIINYGLTWDWWISANSVDKFGNVYIGYIDSEMYGGVLKRQPDGTMQYKRLERCYNDDDHNGMATIVLDNGKILVIGSYGHTVNNHIICWRSTNPYSIDDMEKLSFDIPQSSYTYKTCYSQVFKYNGKLFDFMRFGSYGSSNDVGYACLISSDNGDSWTAYKVFNGTDAYNAMAHATDNEKYLKVVVGANPAGGNYTFKGCYIDLSNYKIYDLSGTEIGEMVALNGGSITDESCAHGSDMTSLIAQTVTGSKGRLFFAGRSPIAKTVFLYATATDSTDKDFTYKIYNDGTVTELGSSGVPFGNGHYISGACFGKDTGTVYYSKATTAIADGNHELHKVQINNNAVASDEIIAEASMCILRPLFLGNGELASVVGHYNDQTSNGYNGSFTAWELKPLFTHA